MSSTKKWLLYLHLDRSYGLIQSNSNDQPTNKGRVNAIKTREEHGAKHHTEEGSAQIERKKMTTADVAESELSRPGPISRCLAALKKRGLVKTVGKDQLMRWMTTAEGTKYARILKKP